MNNVKEVRDSGVVSFQWDVLIKRLSSDSGIHAEEAEELAEVEVVGDTEEIIASSRSHRTNTHTNSQRL